MKRQECHIRSQQITDLICDDKKKLYAELDAAQHMYRIISEKIGWCHEDRK